MPERWRTMGVLFLDEFTEFRRTPGGLSSRLMADADSSQTSTAPIPIVTRMPSSKDVSPIGDEG